MPLPYVGAAPTANNHLVTQAYISTMALSNLSSDAVTTLINNGLAPYVLKSYVDAQDALLATPSFVDAGDATRLHNNQINANSGVAGLDAIGKVSPGRITLTSSQRFPKPYTSPAAYHTTEKVAGPGASTRLFTMTMADPGYSYKVLVFGSMEGYVDDYAGQPWVYVRRTNTNGAILGAGAGAAYFTTDGDGNPLRSQVTILPMPLNAQPIMTGVLTLFVAVGGPPGSDGFVTTTAPRLLVFPVAT